jgi:serine/threonine-protein kinase HipA
MDQLNVYLLDRLAGTLESDGDQLVFRYDPEYLSRSKAVPISYSLPLQAEPFDSRLTTAFFANLLPPDVVRKRLGKILHLSRHNIFGFLEAIGGDCAGAVAVYPPDVHPSEPDKEEYRELSDTEAARILLNLPKRPLNIGNEKGFRISGAGAQDKLIACISDGKISLPLYGTPSTHIIKPEIPAYPNSIHNELFCMRLAERTGFPTPHCELLSVGEKLYYCVERYDRYRENGNVFRLHQEDFCQLTGTDPEMKYESEEGLNIRDCFELIRKMRLGAGGQLDFVRRIIFNFLIGNGDAHAKNFSVLYRGGRTVLAPEYDLLCTEIYSSLSRDTAMSIGGEFKFAKITREHFKTMAQDCGVRPEIVLNQLDGLRAALIPVAKKLAAELEAIHPSPAYSEILNVIEKQSAQVDAE